MEKKGETKNDVTDCEFQFQQGEMYSEVEKFDEAAKWYSKAAKQGHTKSEYRLGELHFADEEYFEAMEFFSKASKKGHKEAKKRNIESIYQVGEVCLERAVCKEGDQQDEKYPNVWFNNKQFKTDKRKARLSTLAHLYKKKAKEWRMQIAKKEHEKAKTPAMKGKKKPHITIRLGEFEQAHHYFSKAAEEGHERAKNKLTETEYQIGEVYFDMMEFKEAETWHVRAAKNDHVGSAFCLGWMYDKDFVRVAHKHEKAKEYYLKAAMKGHSYAQYSLGRLHHISKNHTWTEKWWLRCCEKEPKASYGLASFYNKRGGKEKARKLYLKAAEGGYGIAQWSFAIFCWKERKYAEAEKWALECHEQFRDACWGLGKLYEYIHKDKEKALVYYRKGAEKGHLDCKWEIEKLSFHQNKWYL